MGSELDKDALEKACEAFANEEVESGRMAKFHEDSVAAAIIAYREAMEKKRKPAEEVAREIAVGHYTPGPDCRDCADFGPICPNSGDPCDPRDRLFHKIIAAIRADREGR